MSEPTEKSQKRMQIYTEKYWEKTGTSPHPIREVADTVINGLAQNIDELGRPLCPCNFYPDKEAELERSREWVCACDEMKIFKYCHCLLFVTPEGMPITEYLPEDHEGRQVYGIVNDPTPDKGRELRRKADEKIARMESGRKIGFDKTHLPPAQFECAVIADTHYMIDVGERPLEFESRRKQTQRAGIALQQVATIGADLVIHMGDLVQEYPETPDFKRAMVEARDQIRASNIYPHYVAGNHDVGDKADPTMPTHAATAESLAFFHDLFGPSYYSFDRDLCHFIVLNSQIFNSKIAESDAQWQWFESDLATHKNQRLFLFFHLPLYLWDKNEPGLGHYDNINPPDRDRLLALIQKYKIELLFAAHVHYPFYDQIGKTRYFIAPSTSFTRPGFGHLYASAPPPEQGRDDIGKLGFYLLRIRADHTDIHFIRTKGEIKRPARDHLITCTSTNLSSPIGITLRHPITPIAELPIAYPSTVRQKTRNDQHFLACHRTRCQICVRFPWRDLRDPFQRTRLEMLCSEGITPIATFHGAAHRLIARTHRSQPRFCTELGNSKI